jgi:hypothetical protein
MRISAKVFSRHCASALICIAFAGSLMAQQQQWTVEFTSPDTSRIVETDMWNAGRMNSRFKWGTQADVTHSFVLREVAFGRLSCYRSRCIKRRLVRRKR